MSQPPKVFDMEKEEIEDTPPVAEPEPFSDEEEYEDEDESDYSTSPARSASAQEAVKILNQFSVTLVSLYDRYTALHTLAKEFNGLPESAPIPSHIQIQKATIVYQINGGEEISADLLNIQRVGELGSLLRVEIERLVDKISAHLARIREISTASEQACNQAKYYTRMAQSKNVPS